MVAKAKAVVLCCISHGQTNIYLPALSLVPYLFPNLLWQWYLRKDFCLSTEQMIPSTWLFKSLSNTIIFRKFTRHKYLQSFVQLQKPIHIRVLRICHWFSSHTASKSLTISWDWLQSVNHYVVEYLVIFLPSTTIYACQISTTRKTFYFPIKMYQE